MNQRFTINDLYVEKPENMIDVIVPFLRSKVSIVKDTNEVVLSSDLLLHKSAKLKVLYFLLGQCVLVFSGVGKEELIYSSSKSLQKKIGISKNEADGVVKDLRMKNAIERVGKNNREVLYHIPKYRVRVVMDFITKINNKSEV